jgi:hypothetical protein
MTTANQITSADGGWRVLFAFVAQWPAAAEFLRYTALAERGERASPATLRCFTVDCFASQRYFVTQSKQP